MSGVTLYAPMAGWAAALAAVPDPVFAERMMGDGLAIDPLDGEICAPCDATIVAVAPSLHSVTLKLANGAELLIHAGLETVALKGAGFTAHVADGDNVTRGQKLLTVDLDAVAARAPSLVTPIVVANEGYAVTLLASDTRVAAGDPVAEITGSADAASAPATGDDTASCTVTVPLANGFHARPAARVVDALKSFAAQATITAHGKAANARSVVALLSANIGCGDEIVIEARGDDARAAVAAVAALIESGMGEREAGPAARPSAAPVTRDGLLSGVRAAPGLAVGPVVQFRPADIHVAEQGSGVAEERALLEQARILLIDEAGEGDIAAAHRALIDDPDLIGAADARIAEGKSAAFAWRAATADMAGPLKATGNALLIERIADLKDIERRMIAAITGEVAELPALPDGAILVANELLPSQFLALDPVSGIATAAGGPTSHVAILAASAGVPMVVALGEDALDIADGTTVILDADTATLDPDPADDRLRLAKDDLGARRTAAAEAKAAAYDPCVMADGARIEIFANLGSADDTAHAVAQGAEGCGLLRTEFLFLDRDTAPDEDEQRAAYAAVAKGLGGRPLIVRTLDIGGDKPVAYLPFAHEDNPALGARGIRLSLARPDLLAEQFRAILSGVPAAQCLIMLPMIVDAGEFAEARAILDQARAALGITDPVPFGVMIETPAAALLADSLAREADFLSVGSNDLTQYALAMDRGNAGVAAKLDALHPAVLRLIASVGEGAKAHGRWLGVCGGIASDPQAAAILIGLGVTELSATPAAIPALKAWIRALDMEGCRDLANRALACATAADVRALIGGKDAA